MIKNNLINSGLNWKIVKCNNYGCCDARNNGFKNTKGDYVVFLTADTILKSDYFEFNPDEAYRLYNKAIESSQEPDAQYEIVQLILLGFNKPPNTNMSVINNSFINERLSSQSKNFDLLHNIYQNLLS